MVGECIQQSSLPVYNMLEEMKCILDANDLAANIVMRKGNKAKATFVLLVSPDKSLAIIVEEAILLLYDSHQHLPHGALISCCDKILLDTFCHYMERIVEKYFNSCLLESNLIHLQMMD